MTLYDQVLSSALHDSKFKNKTDQAVDPRLNLPSLVRPVQGRAFFVNVGPLSKRSVIICSSSSCPYVVQIILRNENFTPPAIGGHDRANYLKLTSIRNLLGRAGQLFLLFGMLARNEEGKLCLEDGESRVVLDMEDAVPGEGLFTEGCMVLIEGQYTVEETVRVLAMGHPPSERRDIARSLHGHVDFLGGGAVSLKEEVR